MNLREITKDLHHSAERHPIGSAMADGTISAQHWADWLGALLLIHKKIDPFLPVACGRVAELISDLEEIKPYTPRPNSAAANYVENLTAYSGAFYVFTGAHLMGGAVIRKKLLGKLPCEHLDWKDRKAAIHRWQHLREDASQAVAAKDAFSAILKIMNEIYEHPR